MRKLETLILASRRATENQEFTESAGIQDEEFIQYFNDGQEEIHTLLNQAFPHIIMGQKEISLSGGQEGYDIPNDVFLGTRIDLVEYTSTGNSQNYYPLKKGSLKERLNGLQSEPSFYIRNGTQLLLQPAPQSQGLLRVSYQRAIPKLDIQRATVETVTISGTSITYLKLSESALLDTTALNEENYITVCDKNGNVKMRDIAILGVTSSGVVSVDPSFQFEAGETIATDDLVFRGTFSCNFSQLPDVCEKYMLEYVNARILIRDSSQDAGAVAQVLQKVQGTLQMAFAEPDNDPDYIPVLDAQYLGWDSF
jgi:hypothetical protein